MATHNDDEVTLPEARGAVADAPEVGSYELVEWVIQYQPVPGGLFITLSANPAGHDEKTMRRVFNEVYANREERPRAGLETRVGCYRLAKLTTKTSYTLEVEDDGR
jgi:hypothetical protein